MVTYTNDKMIASHRRAQPSLLSPFGWYFVCAMLVASTMGAALAFAT
jgi:uncharacterized membrane protein (DUF106 family)